VGPSNPTRNNDDWSRLQAIMDVIGSEPGSILVRGPDMWIALPPGNVGDILVINDGAMPEWMSYDDWKAKYG